MGIDIEHYRAAIGSFVSARNISYKYSRKWIKVKSRKYWSGIIKYLLMLIVGFLAAAELSNLKITCSNVITVSEKHSLLSLQGEPLNIKRVFLKHQTINRAEYYQFSNLDNHYSKYTNGNRRNNGIKIYHFNKGNSFLATKIHEIENIISMHRPHVLGISEANFFQDHDYEAVQIENYKLITAKTLQNEDLKVSRVCVYLHVSMVGQLREDLMNDSFSSIWVEVGLPQKRKIIIGNAYREWGFMRQADPSVSRDLAAQKERWSSFLSQWERALDEDKEVIVLGDMNINHLEWTKDDLPAGNQTHKLKPLINDLFSRILPHGVSQLINSATRIRENNPESGLDHFYSNQPSKLSPVQVINCGGSDHKLIGATRYANSIKRNVRYITKRCYKNFKKEEFISAVKLINWWEVYQCDDVDQALQIMTENLTKILDVMAPIRTIQMRENYAPWLSCETKQLMAKRDIAQKKASETKSNEDWIAFKGLRNSINSKLKNEKRNWQRSKFKQCEDENNTKQLWTNVKSWLNWTTSGAPTQLFYDGKLENRPCDLADCMNKFFINKVAQLRDNIGPSDANPLENLQIMMSNRKCVFQLQPVHPDTVDEMISNLRNSGSVGLDYVDTGIIKLIKKDICPAVTHIINLSIKHSTFPTPFKKAKVVPLHKSGDRLNPKNYRPVAILPVLSKLLERAVFTQMISYFESNNLLHPNHHGFRANHNTTTALIQMYDAWVEAMDRGEATGVCFLDMSAAFDMVNHSVLLDKLLLYGFDATAFTWIQSYLVDRKQTVCIDGTCSKLLSLEVGVPQGSIIGPLLYIIFTNDLPEAVHGHPSQEFQHLQESQHPQDYTQHSFNMSCPSCGSICCFADDSSYSYSSKVATDITSTLSEKYQAISEYMKCHQLKLNSDKTHLMLFMSDASRKAKQDFSVTLDTQAETIHPSKSEKLLGGIIAQNLKFTQHIRDHEDSMLKTLNKRLNALKKVSKFASFKSRKMIANGIIISKLIYLIPLWSGCEKFLLNALQIVQNKAARTVTRCGKRTPIKTLLTQCGWLSVAQLSVYHSLLLMYKIFATKSPHYLYSKMTQVQAKHYKTRHMANQIENQTIKLDSDSQAEGDTATSSFKYRATHQWNKLPLDVRQAGTLKVFKLKLRNWVANNIPIK